MLSTTTKDHPFNWENQIRKACMAYNTSVHASTGYTPFYLMFGHKARLPIDLMHGTGENNELSTNDYAVQLKKRNYLRPTDVKKNTMINVFMESH